MMNNTWNVSLMLARHLYQVSYLVVVCAWVDETRDRQGDAAGDR